MDSKAIMVGKLWHQKMDLSSKQKINKKATELHCMPDQMDITVIYRTFHSTNANYKFFLSVHGTFTRVDNMRDQKLVTTTTIFFFLVLGFNPGPCTC
jgi:hypothetical protein